MRIYLHNEPDFLCASRETSLNKIHRVNTYND